MISPVTSTKVATNGADDVAGSKPSFFNNKGSMEPASDPHKTIPINVKPTVKATISQCGPYILLNGTHAVIRKKPIIPRVTPSIKPDNISRRITRHQSEIVTSPNAIACMIKC